MKRIERIEMDHPLNPLHAVYESPSVPSGDGSMVAG